MSDCHGGRGSLACGRVLRDSSVPEHVPEGACAIGRMRRAAIGLTQWHVAQKAHVAPWAVSAVETGARYVPPRLRSRIRHALGFVDDEAGQ